jgi:Capsule assembly protein Wzi
MLRRSLFILWCLCVASVSARAQLAATVPAEDPVYDLLTEVADVLGMPGYVTGQRPLSRREIARILLAMDTDIRRRDSGTTLGAGPPQRIRDAVALMLQAYDADVRELRDPSVPSRDRGMPIEALQIDALGTNSGARRVPNNGLGAIDAYSNPLTDGRWGRPTPNDGVVLSVETSHRIGLGDQIAFGAQPRISWLDDTTRGSRVNAGFQRLYARGVWHNAALEVGPDEYLWGLGGTRGMLLSANPQPLHSVTLSTDTAITLPWLLHAVGPLRAIFLVANLGQDRNFPGAKLLAYQISATPTDRLEIGGGIAVQIGGQGAPPASLTSEVGTLFPYVFWVVAPGRDTIKAAHLAQAEARWRISESRGLSAYYELGLTDFDPRRLKSVYTQNGTHLLGLTMQRLTPDGRLAADLQFHKTSLYQAEHYEYTSGWTYHQAIIGEPLGPNATAGYATLTWRPAVLDAISLDGALESRDPSPYRVLPDNSAIKVSQGIRENRARVLVTATRVALGSGVTMSSMFGVERASNADFVSGNDRTNLVAQLYYRLAF